MSAWDIGSGNPERKAVERVRNLHQRGIWTATGKFYCKHCRNREVEWPCPTIRALDGDSND